MKVNRKLLKSLYEIDHPSKSEYPIINFIINYCYKIPKLSFELDHYNNLFITKNTTNPELYPLIVAHMDSVHDFAGDIRTVEEYDGVYSAYKLNQEKMTQCGLSADDCNGILVALQLLEAQPNLKVLFTTEEEIGVVGAGEATLKTEFFENVSFAVQADRRGNNDLITHTNGIESASDEFVIDIHNLTDKYGYRENTGTFTDIGIIAEELQISGVNISCGYYNEHTNKEFCVISELQNCLNYISEIVTLLRDNGKKYRIPKRTLFHHNHPYYGYDYYDEYDDKSWEDYFAKAEEESPTEDDSEEHQVYNFSGEVMPCDRCVEMDCMNCDKVWNG